MRWHTFIVLSLGLVSVYGEYYDTFTGKEIDKSRYETLNRTGFVPYCAIEVSKCDPYAPRAMDGSCNNPRYPPRGATLTPYRRMLSPVFGPGGTLRSSKSGKPLPLVRPLRVDLMSDGRRPSDRFTHMVVNYHVFLTGDITSLHDTVNYVVLTRTCCQPGGDQDPRCIPVTVKDDDLHLRRSNVRCMNLTRAITYQRLGCVSNDVPLERVNTATPLPDLSVVYGNDARGAAKGREFKDGRLKAEMLNGKEWPPSGAPLCINNVQPRETRCHDSAMVGSNAILGMNLQFIWFFRSHNAIADALKKINPCWDDNKLYYTAREINIAYYHQIFYYELMPLLVGWDFLVQNKVVFPTRGHVDDYEPALEPGTSIDYVAATRWFHTVQEGKLNLYTADGKLYGSVAVVDFILRTGALPLNNTIEGMTQGSFRQAGADADDVVDPDVGERILGRLQFASDVVSSDILKGRDLGLPPYNHYRKLCGLSEAKKFKHLLGWMDRRQVETMAMHYEHPDDIDIMAALLAEKPMPGAWLGPTLSCIMAEQMRHWRRSDRFWFENPDHPGAFTQDQLFEIRKMTMSKLLCLHGDSVKAIQPNAFYIPGYGNEIMACHQYEFPDLNTFQDNKCYPHPTPSQDLAPYLNSLPYDYKYQFEPKTSSEQISSKMAYSPREHVNPSIPLERETSKVSLLSPFGILGQKNQAYSFDQTKFTSFDPEITVNREGKLNIHRSDYSTGFSNNKNVEGLKVNSNEKIIDNTGPGSSPNIASVLYPNPDPKVSIYPNSNPVDSDIYKHFIGTTS